MSFSEKTERAKQELESALEEAEKYIGLLDDTAEYRVMKYRYIDFMKWDDIAARMFYSRQHLARIYNRALRHISERMLHSEY